MLAATARQRGELVTAGRPQRTRNFGVKEEGKSQEIYPPMTPRTPIKNFTTKLAKVTKVINRKSQEGLTTDYRIFAD